MKEEFETWAKSQYMTLRLSSTGEYWVENTQAAWESWQASRQSLVVRLPEVKEGRNKEVVKAVGRFLFTQGLKVEMP